MVSRQGWVRARAMYCMLLLSLYNGIAYRGEKSKKAKEREEVLHWVTTPILSSSTTNNVQILLPPITLKVSIHSRVFLSTCPPLIRHPFFSSTFLFFSFQPSLSEQTLSLSLSPKTSYFMFCSVKTEIGFS